MALANIAGNALKKMLGTKRLFYVCRDIERAEAGLLIGLPNFRIITNNSEYSRGLAKKYKSIRTVKARTIMDTREILSATETKKLIKKGDCVLVFKPTESIERICAEHGWKLLNPDAALASKIEEKISQVKWLDELKRYLPLIKIDLLKNIFWPGNKFILQFNRAHTGSGTILIDSAKKLSKIKKQFPERDARISKFVEGPSFTVNCLVADKKILIGNISYQITGLPPFTDNPFATIGNDWQLPRIILNKRQLREIKKIAVMVGKKMRASGWRGLFGIDLSLDKKTGKIYLIEINARQPASTSFESILQNNGRRNNGLTVFGAHLLSLAGIPLKERSLIKIQSGAQLVQRVTAATPHLTNPYIFKPVNFQYIRYRNTKIDSDLMRVQTKYGIMDDHNKMNEHGNELSIFIRSGITGRIFNGPRAGVIIVKNKKILLLERNRFGYHYMVIPGGTLEKEEKAETTARREIFEETGLKIEIDKEKKPIIIDKTRHETYFWAICPSGKARLGGPEKERNTKGNHYALKWVDIRDIEKINLLPHELRRQLIKTLL